MSNARSYSIDPAAGAVVVTGAASGIGRAVVDLLVEHRVPVVALDVSPVVEDGWDRQHVLGLVGSVASAADVDDAHARGEEKFGRIQGAVAAAGIARSGTVVDTPMDRWKEVIDVNLTGVFLLASASVQRFAEQGYGSFVAIASQVGLVGYPNNAAYCSAKAGVINLMRSISIDFAGQGVRANAVCPGPIDTPMTQDGFRQSGEDYETVLRRVPAARMGHVDEVAAATTFLLSEDATFINGSAMTVDGGYTAQ